ncbi:hypothetical protein J3458_000988 [Metarhizium acridum]|uniref:uncharacterized protein n=1 Tax=Metarhizium acridum TaxID=92637 RepID=UPI001C6C8B34|nr:hypothetical protein J3458_000988 [Metarhizium acridum]
MERDGTRIRNHAQHEPRIKTNIQSHECTIGHVSAEVDLAGRKDGGRERGRIQKIGARDVRIMKKLGHLTPLPIIKGSAGPGKTDAAVVLTMCVWTRRGGF